MTLGDLFTPGDRGRADITFLNRGDTTSEPFDFALYLSTDSTISSTDTPLGSGRNGWGVGKRHWHRIGNVDFTLPPSLSAGTYYLGVVADSGDEISESNENNNTAYERITVNAVEIEPDTGDSIRLLAGTINGVQVDLDAPIISVKPGASIAGLVRIAVHNSHRAGAIFPVGATTSWGSHQTGYWTIDSWAPPVTTTEYDVPLNLIAPSNSGIHAIIFAAAAETSLDHVMSATHWVSGAPRWNNGDDIAGWGDTLLDAAVKNGYVTAPLYGKPPSRFGATVIRVVVTDDDPEPPR